MKKLFVILSLSLFFISFASAVCTVTLDQTNYVEGETVTANLICSENGEKNIAYTLNWTNASGYELEVDTGTTPAVRNTLFAQTYTLPSGYATTYGDTINASLTGEGILEGTDSAPITTAGTTNLIIKDISITPEYFLEKFGAISYSVQDEVGNNISNARCIIDIVDGNNLPLISSGVGIPTQGNGKTIFSQLITSSAFEKAKTYKWDIACACFNTTSYTSSTIGSCYEAETGNQVTTFKNAITQYPFTVTDVADKMVVNKTVDITNTNGIWLENKHGHRINITENVSLLEQENINWSSYNNSDGAAFLTAGEKFRVCMYANNTFEEAKHIQMDHIHLIKYPGTEIFPYCMSGEMCKDQENMHIEIQEGNYQKCGDWIKLPKYIKGQNKYKVLFHMSVEGYEQEFELSSDRFTVFGEKSTTDYIPLVDITNVTTDKYGNNISSLSDIQVTFTYDYFGDDEDIFVAEYCFEQTDDDSIGGCYEREFNPDFGKDKQIVDTFELPYFLNDGNAEVAITVFQDQAGLRIAENIRGYGDTEPYNTFTIKNFNVTNLTTSAYNSVVAACDDINVTLTYDFWGDEEAEYVGSFCIENVGDDNVKECEEISLDPDRGAGNTISHLLTLPYFDVSGEVELELFIYKKYPDGTKRFVEHGDTEPYNRFNITTVLTDECKYSESFSQVLDLRNVVALEGIENKTGTFHLDVACPSAGTIGSDMDCTITAYVEDSQIVEKEVDFTCYVSDGLAQYSSVNFNQMVTRTSLSLTRSFAVPSTFTGGTSYILQCYADYYNLGSRRDTFYDTFTASTTTTIPTTGGGGSSIPINDTGKTDAEEESPTSIITGGIIGVDKDLEGEFYNPLTPKGKRVYFFFAIILLLIAALIFITAKIKNKCKGRIRPVKSRHQNLNLLKKIAGIILFILFLLFVVLGIYALGNNLINAYQPIQESIIKDPLFRTIILSTFIIILIIILFKVLNIKAQISIGETSPIEKYWKSHKKHFKN